MRWIVAIIAGAVALSAGHVDAGLGPFLRGAGNPPLSPPQVPCLLVSGSTTNCLLIAGNSNNVLLLSGGLMGLLSETNGQLTSESGLPLYADP